MISTKNFSDFFPELIKKLIKDLDDDKVLRDNPFRVAKVYVLVYSISKDEFFLSSESTFDRKFRDFYSGMFDADLIPLFRLQDGEFLDKTPKPKFKEKIKSVVEKDIINNNLLIDSYWGISFFESISGENFKSKENTLLKSLLKKVQQSGNKNIFDELNLEHPFYKHLTNLLKVELDQLTLEGFSGVYDVHHYQCFFSKKDNGGFIKELFGSDYSKEFLNNCYKIFKDDNLELSYLYNLNPDLHIWDDKFDEISSKFFFDNQYQFVGKSDLELFVAKKLLEKGEKVLFEHSDFIEAVSFLDLIKENKNLTVKITDGNAGELAELSDYYDESRLSYFEQHLSENNLYVPICLPEDEQATILEYYKEYSENTQVEIAEFWCDVVDLLSSYKELLDAGFFGTLDLENVILEEYQEQRNMDIELESYRYR